MNDARVSAVLFAKNRASLTTFYRETLGLVLSKEADDHAILSRPGFDLVVHQIPEPIARTITIASPPRRREQGAIKLSFPVESLARVRATAASLGGLLDPPDTEWTDGSRTTCMGHDPEGNVFQVTAPAGTTRREGEFP